MNSRKNSELQKSMLEIPVMSGELCAYFFNAPWEKIRDEIYPLRVQSSSAVDSE